MTDLASLPGLGPKSARWLNESGIHSLAQLQAIGAIRAYAMVSAQRPVSLNLLYALVGALEGRRWQDVAKQDRASLIMALDGYQQLTQMAKEDDQPA
ncbi:TfoX/Sxy family protein [Bowmanella denitrificans]|uniref:TfoX/Sxy family protein n=1 Tax=Bowmanella denitrificans TaxID=366582 RepID=UPI000C9B93D0|nr:TfoX/Sxy family protein [Bowmanella denitrificans]